MSKTKRPEDEETTATLAAEVDALRRQVDAARDTLEALKHLAASGGGSATAATVLAQVVDVIDAALVRLAPAE